MQSGSRRFGKFAGLFRRLAVLAALGAFLLATTGVPLPSAQVKDLSQPFPCMDRVCGCRSAAQCWKGCCCFSDREKLVWAAVHNVTPPAFVIARASLEPRTVEGQVRLASNGRTVNGRTGAKCCVQHPTGGTKRFDLPVTSPRPRTETTLVIASAWRQCHGFAPTWSVLGAVVPPPETVTWQFEWTSVGEVYPTPPVASAIRSAPPLPPPRA
jgi:hypothetical protein